MKIILTPEQIHDLYLDYELIIGCGDKIIVNWLNNNPIEIGEEQIIIENERCGDCAYWLNENCPQEVGMSGPLGQNIACKKYLNLKRSNHETR